MNILVIENDLILLSAITRVYKDIGHDVTPTATLDEALKYIKYREFDLITIDLRMNGKSRSGLEAYHLARKKWKSELPVVVITGCDDDMLEDAKQYTSQDIYYKIYKKPIDINTLEEIIRFSQEEATIV